MLRHLLILLACLVACGDDSTADTVTSDAQVPDDAGAGFDGTLADGSASDSSVLGDANGGDAGPPSCPTCDGDGDGFDGDVDCDDADSSIYPGVGESCSADCGEGSRLCGDDGSWSECDCTPVCEARGEGRCFYISAERGSDDNEGSFAAPWETYLNVVSYYGPDDAPASAIRLGPGDVVYFMDGEYDATYSYNSDTNAFFLRNVHGEVGNPIAFRAYPGHRPLLTTGQTRTAVVLFQSSHLLMDGFEVRDSRGNGIRLDDANFVELSRLHVTDVIGPSASNVAGIHVVSSENLNLHHSSIHDIQAEGEGGNVWSHGAIFFGGGNHRLHHNEFYTTPPRIDPMRRGCVLYKHSATVEGSTFEVDHNVFRGCEGRAIGSGSFGTDIHHNLFLGSGVSFEDFGGPTHHDSRVVSNTFVDSGGMSYNPTDDWEPVGLTTFSDNIVVDSSTYGAERGIITIGTYISDSLYEQTVDAGNLAFSDNCYFNPTEELRFNLFAAGGSFGDLGAIYTFEEWQALGYDVDSAVVDPGLDERYVPSTDVCASAGWRPLNAD